MRHLIVWALLRALTFCLPARGQHRPTPTPEAPPLHICGWDKPTHPHHLLMTMPPAPFEFRIAPALTRWERLSEEARRAELAAHAETAWTAWLKIKTEAEKRRQTPEDQRRRRVELFAVSHDLPSPFELAEAMG
ncbi:hypothetical protein [Kitasatospora purpeofusca]|uniref:hypothetical protein n=1 Tax=Kitasatospora purpeofusca TaxID=67352 RepID=UPI00386FC303